MTTTFDKAVERARKMLPAERQEYVGKVLLELVELEVAQPDNYELTDEDHAAIDEGIAAADTGDFASEEEVKRVFDKYA